MARFVHIAMGSAAELSCHLLVAKDLGFMKERDYASLHQSTSEVLRMLSALSETLKPHQTRAIHAKS